MYNCESCTVKSPECWRIGAFELWCWRRLKSPLDCKEIKPVHPKGNQTWIFIERTDAEAEAPILWSSEMKSWLIRKDSDAGKDWGQEEKRVSEDETAGWYHWCSGHELEQTLGGGEGQGGLACCSAWGRRESDATGGLNSNSRISGGPLLTVLGLSGPFNLASGGFIAVSLWLATMLPFGTQRRSWSLESCPGMGNKKTSVPRTHTGPCSVLPSKPLWNSSAVHSSSSLTYSAFSLNTETILLRTAFYF